MRKDRVIQKIFDTIEPFAPNGWAKLVFYAEYDQYSYSMEFYALSDGRFVKCFDLPGVSRNDLIEAFDKIDKALATERKKLSGKNTWTSMTMVVQSDGKVKVDYDYADLTEGAYAYKKAWKKKYLN